MNITADPNQLLIAGLIFLLGLLIGVFLTAGGRRKWKTRYDSEVSRRRELEKTHEAREKHWADQEKEWRERDSLRGSAARSPRDLDGDGVRDDVDRRPTDDRRA
jgi:hypothetical protein